MHAEIDLLHIIKQLRVANFTYSQYLKPHQIKMIRWFDQYKVVIKPGEMVEPTVSVASRIGSMDRPQDDFDLNASQRTSSARSSLITGHSELIN